MTNYVVNNNNVFITIIMKSNQRWDYQTDLVYKSLKTLGYNFIETRNRIIYQTL